MRQFTSLLIFVLLLLSEISSNPVQIPSATIVSDSTTEVDKPTEAIITATPITEVDKVTEATTPPAMTGAATTTLANVIPVPATTKRPTPKPIQIKTLDCSNKTIFLDPQEISIGDMEYYAKSLRNIDQLHHTDKCDPDLDDNIHTKVWTLEKGHVLTVGKLHELSCGMKETCAGGRNMMCDPARKRCVCKPNSFWLPLTETERMDPQLNMNKGRCYLKVGSKCRDQKRVAKKMEQLVCVENSKCVPVKIKKYDKKDNETEMQCFCRMTIKERQPNGSLIVKLNQGCYEAVYKQSTQLKTLVKQASERRWRSFGEECTSVNEIDTRVHTLRSIDVKLNREWSVEMDNKFFNGTSQRCNFAKGLNCDYENKCVCKPFYSWNATKQTCVGGEGAFCELRIWGERDTVGIPMPCSQNLSCIVAQHPDTHRPYHVCCYIEEHSFRKSLTYNEFHMCPEEATESLYEDATSTVDPLLEYLEDEEEDYYDYDDSVDVANNNQQSKIIVLFYMIQLAMFH